MNKFLDTVSLQPVGIESMVVLLIIFLIFMAAIFAVSGIVKLIWYLFRG